MTSLDAAVASIDAFVGARMATWGPPSVALAITDRERTLAVRAYGYANLEAQVPTTPETLFQIGSVSKSFTALMVMQLVEAGLVGLQNPISDYIPWFTPRQKMRAITVHDLLTHTSGLPIGSEFHLSGLLEAISGGTLEPGAAPGGNPTYSNLGYKVLGYLVERLTQLPYAQAVHERVFAPLGMGTSYGAVTDALRPWTAVGYHRLYDDRPWQRAHPWVQSPYEESDTGDGPIVSTVEDMASYLRCWMRSGAPVVKPETFDVMTRPHATFDDVEHPGETYGYALESYEEDGHRFVGHTGGMIAHTTYCFTDMTAGVGVIVFGSSGGTFDIGEYALRAAIDSHASVQPRSAPAVPDPLAIPEAAALAGTWAAGARTLALIPEANGLIAEFDGERADVERRGDDAFLVLHPAYELHLLRVERAAPGAEPAALTHGGDRYERAGMAWSSPVSAAAAWEAFVGHFVSRLPWAAHLRVTLRAGTLYLSEPGGFDPGENETELVPLPDGRTFRLGAEEWRPSRVRFGDVINGRAMSLQIDNAVYGRAFTP